MTQHANSKVLLYRARLLVEEGRYEAAHTILVAIHADDDQQQKDVAYLLGWCYIQRKQWEEAFKVLSPILEQSGIQLERASPQEREQQALALLRLGLVAFNLSHFEDAALHFTLCLKVLHDRRVHLPAVRITARYSLAMTCAMRGLYTTAIQHYEEALRQSRHYRDESEVPQIFYGLCNAYLANGDFANAYEAGQEALRLYQNRSDGPMEARTHTILGRVCFLQHDFKASSDHYTESLAISTQVNGPTLAMANCTALADLRLAEDRVEEARRYVQLALTTMERVSNIQVRGRVYHVVAKVTCAEAHRLPLAQRQFLLESCVDWYEKAKICMVKTQAYGDMADVCNELAQVLEELGRVTEAIDNWREGYALLNQAKDTQAL